MITKMESVKLIELCKYTANQFVNDGCREEKELTAEELINGN